jgi:hypothetical protein
VVICALSLAVLVAMAFTGPLAGYLVRRRETRAASKAPKAEPTTEAPPTIVRRPQSSTMPRIARLKEDSTTVLPAAPTEEFSAPTATLRIKRREPPPDATTQLRTPPK